MTDGNNAEPNAIKNKLQQQASKMQQSNSKLGAPESREESTERDGAASAQNGNKDMINAKHKRANNNPRVDPVIKPTGMKDV